MKLLFAALALATRATAGSVQDGCSFTLTSSGVIACPVGQLLDGQIRLNGSYEITNFHISDGAITDSEGKGCLITDPPTTQFQCDLNRPSTGGFAIDSSNVLTYNGSPQFYACPATDTEYNLYVHPDFGQAKCFPISLTASGCGAAPDPACTAGTVLQTITELQTTTVTVMVTTPVDVTVTVSPNNYTTSSRTGCYRCTARGNSTGIWNTTSHLSSSSESSSAVSLPVTDTTATFSATGPDISATDQDSDAEETGVM